MLNLVHGGAPCNSKCKKQIKLAKERGKGNGRAKANKKPNAEANALHKKMVTECITSDVFLFSFKQNKQLGKKTIIEKTLNI